ncbi:MAG: lytic murein transglycosylase [Hyphomicrobiaceae bacterium]|nr:lytic murein transglycosylase [Hyphomicrobiaceae bacterium]
MTDRSRINEKSDSHGQNMSWLSGWLWRPLVALPLFGLIASLGFALPIGVGIITAGSQSATAAPASDKRFRQWVERLWPSARRKGVSRRTFNTAFRGVLPDPEVIRSAHYQPEFVRPVWDYLASAASDRRIEVGMAMLRENKDLFDRLEKRFKVDRYVIVAIWGMESNFGLNKGSQNVIRSLATLAYRDRRRRKFGRQQLLSALKILQRGDISAAQMKGSWAGAMGHTQFIPTTYSAYAVDFTGDGKRDIWNSPTDALASTANYLRVSKWRFGHAWGYEIKLPKKMKSARTRLKRRKNLSYWKKLGLKRINGKGFPRLSDKAALYLPAGAKGPAFLVLNNFRSILRYNNAATYALAVGHLSDRLRGAGPFVQSWPTKHKPLARDERLELQRLLTAKGFDTGGTDGVIGNATMHAVRKYQKSRGLKVDGWPSARVLKTLRNDS